MAALLEYIQSSSLAMWGLLGLLILCGLGLPLPEDVILLAAGLIAGESGGSWIYASVLMYAGVIAGDSLIFGAGRHFGHRLLRLKWTQRLFSPHRQERVQRLFARYGSTAFFLARFMPGLRAPIFGTAGAMKVRYLQFLVFDGAAALISVPFFVWLGSFLWRQFGGNLDELRAAMAQTHSYTLMFALGVLAVVAALVWFNRRRLIRATR